ncbi:MAG: ABC transporter ATP-binding protein [Acidimicrobiales bacterium]|nr:ABC transporter ATP-binding protein [Acidimicrobiales bacterium]
MTTSRPTRDTAKNRTPRPAVRTTGLTKRYGEVPALAPLDIEVPAREHVAIVGHNGSGKSTLLAMLAGSLDPSGGSASIFGSEPGSIDARRAVSYLPDSPVLYDDLSVREHLQYVSRLHGTDDGDDRADELIERLGLTKRADDLPSQFSRGLRQKTAIAVGLCRPFRLLLVDEPFVGLDDDGRHCFVTLLAEARDRGATTIVATHDPGELGTIDRRLVLRDGELIEDSR